MSQEFIENSISRVTPAKFSGHEQISVPTRQDRGPCRESASDNNLCGAGWPKGRNSSPAALIYCNNLPPNQESWCDRWNHGTTAGTDEFEEPASGEPLRKCGVMRTVPTTRI
jgi:hypothetical protein